LYKPAQGPQFTGLTGQLQVSALAQDNEAGAVVLQTMRADGKMIEDTITKLPQSSTLESSYSTLVPADGHKNLRLVLNMAIQDTYSTDVCSDFQLPVVLDKDKGHVSRVVYTGGPQLEFGSSCGKRNIEGFQDDFDKQTITRKKQR
jgi:hypothetical protein